jgi:hypothetical protein
VKVHDRDIDQPMVRQTDGALGRSGYGNDLEVWLLIEQPQQSQLHGGVIVHHEQAEVARF